MDEVACVWLFLLLLHLCVMHIYRYISNRYVDAMHSFFVCFYCLKLICITQNVDSKQKQKSCTVVC